MMMHTLLPDASNPASREIVHQDERDRIRRSHDAYTNGKGLSIVLFLRRWTSWLAVKFGR